MFPIRLLPHSFSTCTTRPNVLRSFTACASLRHASTNLPPRIQVKEEDIEENFIKGGGAGGQKINKTNSQNRTIARRILAERIEELEKGDQSRSALKAQKAIKKKANAMKKTRRKYRKLDEEQSTTAAVDAPTEEDRPSGEESVADSSSKD